MSGRRTGTEKWLILAGAVILLAAAPASAQERSPETIRVGMVNSLCRYVPDSVADLALQPFSILMKSQTGLTGEMSDAGSPENLARQIKENRLQLGVLFGIEYAWVRQKYPELRPLMIAINQDRHLHAHLVVRSDSSAKDFADLKGKVIASSQQSREHCCVFLERRCLKCGQKPEKHFSKVTTPANAEDALDDVVEGRVDAAVIDGPPLDCYKRRKPGRVAKIKVIQVSEIFPASVVVYRPGVLDEATLQRFREGMSNAHKSVVGQRLLNLCRLTAFGPVPDDYEQTVANIVKLYPPPKAGESK